MGLHYFTHRLFFQWNTDWWNTTVVGIIKNDLAYIKFKLKLFLHHLYKHPVSLHCHPMQSFSEHPLLFHYNNIICFCLFVTTSTFPSLAVQCPYLICIPQISRSVSFSFFCLICIFFSQRKEKWYLCKWTREQYKLYVVDSPVPFSLVWIHYHYYTTIVTVKGEKRV